jgi:predicted permease
MMLHRFRAYVRDLAMRRRREIEADEELAFHLEQETAANVARGLSPAEARRLALAQLGGVTQTREAIRDVRRTALDGLVSDLRHAFRSLRATPSFTLVALATLTLAIGASTAIFSIVDAVILRALPFPRAERLVAIGEARRSEMSNRTENLVAPQNFLDWRAQQTAFDGIAAIGYARVSLKADRDREPETLQAQAVTSEFFAVLGVKPLLGRTFTLEHEVSGRARVAVISYSLWQRRFDGTPDIVGRMLPGQTADLEILGVMPPSFAFPAGARRPTEVWLPNVFTGEDRVRADSFSYRLQVIGRLKEGVALGAAQAQMDQVTARLAAETPRWFEDRVTKVEPLREYLTRGVRTWMLLLLAAVACVLLIACVNLANLMLVRSSVRGREMLIRSALGASRWDLIRVVLAECLLLSSVGAALGAAAAWFAVDVFRTAIPAEVPRAAAIAVDLRVLAITTVTAIATGVAIGLAPMAQFWRPAVDVSLAPSTRGHTAALSHRRLRGALVVVEVALATMLLIGSGLFLASFARVSSVDLGFDPRNVLTVRIRPGAPGQDPAMAQRRHLALLHELLADAQRMPGVDSAALVNAGLPLRGDFRTIEIAIPGRALPADEDIDYNAISPDFFRSMRVPLRKGRFFTDADRKDSEPVMIVDEVMARKYFPGEDPVGRIVQFAGTRRIVGITASIRHEGPEAGWREQGFIPIAQSDASGATLVLRLARGVGPAEILPAIKAAVWTRFPGLALPDVQTLAQYLHDLVAQRRFNMLLLGLFGLLGVVIACVGIYGVIAYVVTLRTQEIGIRAALGAAPAAILWSVLRMAVLYLAGGLIAGLAASWLLGAFVSSLLFQVEPRDPWVYTIVAATLAATGVVAAVVPARRAAGVDPLIALRQE